jgi:nucleoside-diphosphate-sugar epimerase
MLQKDISMPVLVTGANGYVASWLVKKLLNEGFTVHAAVRQPNNDKKIGHLKKAAEKAKGQIKFFQTDLLKEGTYKEAMQGCSVVFHTASPFTSDFKDPQKELIDPAVKGTENVLRTASETPTVRRVVLTSSCAAMYSDAIDTHNAPGGRLTEAVWNTTASLEYQPYSYSKTLAEKKAWEIAQSQSQWDLVVINPSLVMGPPMNPQDTTSESFSILKQMGDGTFKSGAPKLGVGLVDVRDVAEAHFRGGFMPKANGRYITAGHATDFYEMVQTLLPKYGGRFPLPKSAAPKWLLLIVGPFVNKALSRKFIRNNINIAWMADNSKIKNELGIVFRPISETMNDGFQALIDAGILQPKK